MNNVSQQLTDRAVLGLYRTKRDYEKSDHTTTEDLHHFHYYIQWDLRLFEILTRRKIHEWSAQHVDTMARFVTI